MYYKVVTIRNGKLYSGTTYNKYAVEYLVGDWVYPKIGKLFVFTDLERAKEHAKSFNWSPHPTRLYSCEVNNPVKCINRAWWNAISTVREYWEDYVDGASTKNAVDNHDPCVYVDSVKLLEEIT